MISTFHNSWWRHQMETSTALLALCAGNSPVFGEFPSQRPVTRCFDVSLIYVWTNGWANIRDAGDLRRHRAHYDITVMFYHEQLRLSCLILGRYSRQLMTYHALEIRLASVGVLSDIKDIFSHFGLPRDLPPRLCVNCVLFIGVKYMYNWNGISIKYDACFTQILTRSMEDDIAYSLIQAWITNYIHYEM